MEGPVFMPRSTTLFFNDHLSELALAVVWHPADAVMLEEATDRIDTLAAQKDNTTAIQIYTLASSIVFQEGDGKVNRDGVGKGIDWALMLLRRLDKAGFFLTEPLSEKHVRFELHCTPWLFNVQDMCHHARAEREQRNNLFMYKTIPMTGCETGYHNFQAQLRKDAPATPIVYNNERPIDEDWFGEVVTDVFRGSAALIPGFGLDAKAPQTKLVDGEHVSLGSALNPIINYAHPLIPTSIWKGRTQPYYQYFVLLPDDHWSDAGVFVVRYGLDRSSGCGDRIIWEKCSVRDDNMVINNEGEREVRGLADALVELLK